MIPKLHDPVTVTYISAAWQAQADQLRLFDVGASITVVTAPLGGGKTTFLEHVLSIESETHRCFAFTASPEMSPELLLRALAEALGCEWEGAEKLSEYIGWVVESAERGSAKVSLWIDDAHNMEDSVFEALLQCIVPHQSARCFRLVLLGEPSLELRLLSARWDGYFREKVGTTELAPWGVEEIQAYWESDPLAPRMREDFYLSLLDATEGLPGEVVHQKQRALARVGGHPQRKKRTTWRHMEFKKISKNIGTHPVFLGIVMGGLIGGSYLLLSGVNEIDTGGVVSDLASIADDRFENETGNVQEILAPVPAVAVATVMNAAMPKKTESVLALPEPKKPEAKQAMLASNATTVTTVHAAAPAMTSHEKYLLNLKKNHYTLQLVGARGNKNIQQFIDQHGIAGRAYSYRTTLSGKEWYVVVYGEYPSKVAAQEAIAAIPDSLKQGNFKPWIREMGSVQREIRQSSQA